MCGRFSLKASPDDLRKTLGTEPPAGYRPRYNIAPTQDVLSLVLDGGSRTARMLRWGLIPFWAEDPRIGNRMINARAETVAQKPAFRNAFSRQRCLVVADGFYEWQASPAGKRPYRIQRPGAVPFCFAGLWERWERGGKRIESCTILTRAADDRIAAIHDRMPVILDGSDYDRWLDAEADSAALHDMIATVPAFDLESYSVSTLVNRPGNDVPECLAPLVE
ncbi:SOS response-associated peptidase [soil metagenome]